jgi:hypothetical protein
MKLEVESTVAHARSSQPEFPFTLPLQPGQIWAECQDAVTMILGVVGMADRIRGTSR